MSIWNYSKKTVPELPKMLILYLRRVNTKHNIFIIKFDERMELDRVKALFLWVLEFNPIFEIPITINL